MRKALVASVTSLAALGMLGGCLIFAQSGFTTSNKRGAWEVFVPAPQAYIMAAIMFALSALAVLWLLRQSKLRAPGYVLCVATYLVAAFILTRVLSQAFQ
ncbi:MAG: hypothetical protein ABL931_05060 [Usitatibacteraceae bacterium]